MIGLFDSGHGGLTILRELTLRFPAVSFVYLGDHANAPYGNRPSDEIVGLTAKSVDALFGIVCTLVLLACNTATAIAGRALQREWLPASGWTGNNVIGVIAPTVEAATQTPWSVAAPQYPQKNNTDTIAVFGTRRTISSGVFQEEIRKRCPKVTVVQQSCPDLAGAISRPWSRAMSPRCCAPMAGIRRTAPSWAARIFRSSSICSGCTCRRSRDC
jgi:glutamate racemase